MPNNFVLLVTGSLEMAKTPILATAYRLLFDNRVRNMRQMNREQNVLLMMMMTESIRKTVLLHSDRRPPRNRTE